MSRRARGAVRLWGDPRPIQRLEDSLALAGVLACRVGAARPAPTVDEAVQHADRYARAGVREYWIADARTELSLRILGLSPQGTFVDQPPTDDGWIASPVWARSFRLRRLESRAGLFDFRLDVRA